MSRDGCVALPRGAMLRLWYFLIILTFYFRQNLEPDLDQNCSSLYPVSTYYIRVQENWRFAGGPIVARDGMLARYSCKLVMMTK